MTAVVNGQIDATLQDLPAALFYRGRYPDLAFAGEPVGRGYYVLYFRHGDEALRDAIDAGIARRIQSGELRRLYERYGIWNDAQGELATLAPETFKVSSGSNERGWSLVRRYGPLLIDASVVDDRALVRLDAAGDGDRPGRGARAAVRAEAAADACSRATWRCCAGRR